MPEGIGYKKSDAEMNSLIKRAKKYGASDEEINKAKTLDELRDLADRYTSMSTELSGPSLVTEDVRLPRKKPKKMNKGGYGGMAMKKPEMMKGGMYKGKKHMYAAGGLVKEIKM